MINQDLYDILGVSKTADQETIKRSYRKLARQYHPDVNPDNQEAEEKFKQASAAFEILGDSEKRKLYDEFGMEGLREGFNADATRKYQQWQSQFGGRGGQRVRQRHGYGTNFQDIFGDIFGGRSPFDTSDFSDLGGFQTQAPPKGRDWTASVKLDFLTAIKGGQVDLKINGKVLKVRIPAGVNHGERLRLKGQGGKPAEAGYAKGDPGDLLLDIQVSEHARLRREGLDLFLDLPVTLLEATEGGRVKVPTPWGEYTVRIPQGVQSGAKLRLKGQGVQRGGRKGDFYVFVQVQTPDKLDEDVKQAIQTIEEKGYSKPVRENFTI